MEIKTKFNVGNKVYLILRSQIVCREITEISTYTEKHKQSIRYNLGKETFKTGAFDRDFLVSRNEDEVFDSLDELMLNAKQKINGKF